MKKFLIIIASALVAVPVIAALDASLLQTAQIIKPQTVLTGTETASTVIDKMPFTGVATITVSTGVNTGGTVNVRLQTAAATTGTFANVSGATAVLTGTNGATASITYDTTAGSRYFRLVSTNVIGHDSQIISGVIHSYK